MALINRRSILKYTSAAAISTTFFSNARVLGANESIRLGVIGIGRQGKNLTGIFSKIPGVTIAALADPDPGYKMGVLKDELANRDENPFQVDIYTDYRKLLDRKDIDAVVIASCNHWHVKQAMEALDAGKHIYLEKPISHNIWEGRQLCRFASQRNLIVTAGMWHRRRDCWPQVRDFIQEGQLGKVLCSRGLCHKRRGSIGLRETPLKAPQTCNYDMWLGPAHDEPTYRENFHYDWHWMWNTGNGDLGNQGVHQFDLAINLAGEDSYPRNVLSIGGRFGYKDGGQTPNTQIVFCDYEPVPVIFEVLGLPMQSGMEAMEAYKKARIGNVVECEGGYISENVAYDNDGKIIKKFNPHGGGMHMQDFIRAIRENDQSILSVNIKDAHTAAAMAHTSNISYRLGSELSSEEISSKIKDNKLLSKTWERMLDHLDRNNVDLEKTNINLGPILSLDPETDRFTGEFSEAANVFVKDDYRKGWEVPQVEQA
jgi:predicted dehydrogenase